MPIEYEGKKYEFGDLVEHIKRSKPDIESPGGYVKKIEEAQRGAKNSAFDNLSPENKLHTLREAVGPRYLPPYDNVKYDDLSLAERQGVDKIFNTEKIAMLGEKLQKLAINKYTCKGCGNNFENEVDLNAHKESIHGEDITPTPDIYHKTMRQDYLSTRKGSMDSPPQEGFYNKNDKMPSLAFPFSGRADTDTKKTGADVEKSGESNPTDDRDPFNHVGKLRAAIRQAIIKKADDSNANMTDDKVEKTKETEGKGDKENEPLKDKSGPNVKNDDPNSTMNHEASLKKNEIKLAMGYKDVIQSFKNKMPDYGGNYHSTGKTLSLFGNPIAEHTDTGVKVTNAGYPTATTHKALRSLGVNVKSKQGITHIDNKPIGNGEWVEIPHSQLTAKEEEMAKCQSCGEEFNSDTEMEAHYDQEHRSKSAKDISIKLQRLAIEKPNPRECQECGEILPNHKPDCLKLG